MTTPERSAAPSLDRRGELERIALDLGPTLGRYVAENVETSDSETIEDEIIRKLVDQKLGNAEILEFVQYWELPRASTREAWTAKRTEHWRSLLETRKDHS